MEPILVDQRRLLTPREAAELLRRSTRCLRRWEQLGLLRPVRPAGGRPLYVLADIERLLREGSRVGSRSSSSRRQGEPGRAAQ